MSKLRYFKHKFLYSKLFNQIGLAEIIWLRTYTLNQFPRLQMEEI